MRLCSLAARSNEGGFGCYAMNASAFETHGTLKLGQLVGVGVRHTQLSVTVEFRTHHLFLRTRVPTTWP